MDTVVQQAPNPYAEKKKTFEDQDEQERVRKLPGADEIDQIFGTTVKQINWAFPDITNPQNGQRLKVTRFYLTEKACFDIADDEVQRDLKKVLLNARRIAYIGILKRGCICDQPCQVCKCGGSIKVSEGQQDLAAQKYAFLNPGKPEAAEVLEDKHLAKEEAERVEQVKTKAKVKAKRHKRG